MRNVERSIRWAVGVALAACTPAQPAPPPELVATSGPTPSASAPTSASANATTTASGPTSPVVASATASASVSPTVGTPAVDAGPPIDAAALCAAYHTAAAANPKGPTHQNPSQERNVPLPYLRPAGSVEAHVQNGRAVCRITWDRSAIQRTAMEAPRCCPPITQPCPGPSPVPVPAERTRFETATLRPDGTLESSSVEWLVWVGSPPPQPYCGRLTAGLRPTSCPDSCSSGDVDGRSPIDPRGAALAEMAELEAISVRAFARLTRELVAFGAPARLVERVRAARADEVRHARATARLARAHGSRPRPVRRARLSVRTRADVARENAVEGCIRETFGAAVATWHAATATDPALAKLFEDIAHDERAHAALAWDVARWLEARLDEHERNAVEQARNEALSDLRARPEVGGPLGLPRPAARALVEALFG